MDATGTKGPGDRTDPMNDTRAARDNRTTEAIAMKDRQIQLLQDQTSQLLRSLDKVGEDAAQLHMSKLAVEEVRGGRGGVAVPVRAASFVTGSFVDGPVRACARPPHPQENRTLREQNFELQSKSRADQNALKRIQAEFADKDKQLRIVVDQHAELLRWGHTSRTPSLVTVCVCVAPPTPCAAHERERAHSVHSITVRPPVRAGCWRRRRPKTPS